MTKRGWLATGLVVLALAVAPAVAANGTWILNDDGDWNPAVTGPWQDGIVPASAGDTAVFGAASASADRTITLTTGITVGAMTVNNAAGVTRTFTGSQLTFNNSGAGATLSYGTGAGLVIASNVRLDDALTVSGNGATAISGSFSGSSDLTKTGTGALTLSGNLVSSYTGNMFVNGGTVRLGSANSLPLWDTYVNTGGTLDLGGFSFAYRDGRVYLAGGSLINSVAGTTSSLNREVRLDAGSTIGGDGNVTFQSTFTGGSHALTKIGAGQTTFSGLVAGNLNIQGGAIQASTANVGIVTMSPGTSLNVTGVPFVNQGLISTAADANVNIGGAGMTMSLDSGTRTFAGVISGTGQLVKSGLGIQQLTGDSTFTGAIRIGSSTTAGGTLQFTTIGDIGAGPSSLGNPTTAANATIDIRAGTLQYIGATPSVSNRPIKTTVASASLGVTPTLSLAANTQLELTGPITIESNTFLVSVGGGAELTLSGTIGGTGQLYAQNSGTGVLHLRGANTYTGGNQFGQNSPSTGTVTLERFGSIGEAATPLGSALTEEQARIILGAQVLQFVGTNEVVNRNIRLMRQTGAVLDVAEGRNLEWAGWIAGGDMQIELSGAGDGVLSGTYRDDAQLYDEGIMGGWPLGEGGSKIRKRGTGTWTLANENSYQNLTHVHDGTLRVTADRALGLVVIQRLGLDWPVDGKVHVYDNATLAFGGNVYYDGQLQWGYWGPHAELGGAGRWHDTDVPVIDPNTGEQLKLYQVVQIVGSGAADRAGAIDNTDGNNTFTGPIQLITEFYHWAHTGVPLIQNQYEVADATIGASAGTLTLTGGINTTSTVSRLDGEVRYWQDLDVINTLTLNPTGGSLVVADRGIVGIGNVVKTGAGVATLSAIDNTWTGFTTIEEGSLRLTGGLAGTELVTVRGNLLIESAFNEDFNLASAAVVFDGLGTKAAPQLLELPGADYGLLAALPVDNFVFGSLAVDSTYVKLVDAFDFSGSGADALYLDTLSMTGTAFIEFGSFKVYYRNGGMMRELIPGDATLSGTVNVDDLGILATNYRQSGRGWIHGDFTGDGVVNVDDLGVLATNYRQSAIYSAAAAAGFGPAVVPEPATLALLAIGGLAVLRRRRNK